MAIAAAHLVTNNSETDAASYDTASITPTGNSLVLAAIYSRKAAGGEPIDPILTGNGLTWVNMIEVVVAGVHKLSLFRAMGASPSAGAVTIDFSAEDQTFAAWTISEFSGVDTTGSNGANAVGTPVTNLDEAANTGLTITLAAFSSATNGVFGAVRAGNAVTAGTGFTELAETTNTNVLQFESQWRADADTSVDWSWASSAAATFGVAVEIKEPSVATRTAAYAYFM